ncbi:MAG TPA: hypothetical protein ENI79_05815, partial [Rhodospirillales bacterium]|nr:hypothetical protein [Rhodospirillales bacterium]
MNPIAAIIVIIGFWALILTRPGFALAQDAPSADAPGQDAPGKSSGDVPDETKGGAPDEGIPI